MMVLTQPIAFSTEAITFIAFPLIGSILLAYGIFQVVMDSRRGQRKRLTERLREQQVVKRTKVSATLLRRQAVEETGLFLGKMVAKLSITPKVQILLDQANVDFSAQRMLVNQLAIAMVAVFGSVILLKSWLVAIVAAACILDGPLMWLRIRRARRMNQLIDQLPDVFELMSQALRAGHSLASAIELVYQQMPDPIGSEFGRVYHEQNLGIKIEDTLISMANRVDSLDVRFFVTAVLIQRQTGGDLSEVLDKIGSVIRQRIELFGLVRSLTAEGRLSGWVLLALPVATFAATCYMNPEYASVLLNDPTGKLMLVAAVGLQLMGLAMIRWIVNIKV